MLARAANTIVATSRAAMLDFIPSPSCVLGPTDTTAQSLRDTIQQERGLCVHDFAQRLPNFADDHLHNWADMRGSEMTGIRRSISLTYNGVHVDHGVAPAGRLSYLSNERGDLKLSLDQCAHVILLIPIK